MAVGKVKVNCVIKKLRSIKALTQALTNMADGDKTPKKRKSITDYFCTPTKMMASATLSDSLESLTETPEKNVVFQSPGQVARLPEVRKVGSTSKQKTKYTEKDVLNLQKRYSWLNYEIVAQEIKVFCRPCRSNIEKSKWTSWMSGIGEGIDWSNQASKHEQKIVHAKSIEFGCNKDKLIRKTYDYFP